MSERKSLGDRLRDLLGGWAFYLTCWLYQLPRHETFLSGNEVPPTEGIALEQRVENLREALEPFATFGENNVDDQGWKDGCGGRDRIVDWFGPSEFRAAKEALAPTQPISDHESGEGR